MESKWRSICGLQTQLLFVFLWVVHPAFAKPVVAEATKKGKAGALTESFASTSLRQKTRGGATLSQTPHKRGKTQAQASTRSSARSTVTRSTDKGKKRGATKKFDKQTISRTAPKGARRSSSAIAAKPTKKGKKVVTAQPSGKTLRLAKSRGATQRGLSAKRQKAQKTPQSAHKKLLGKTLMDSATRRELITRNFDNAAMATRYAPEIAPFLIQVNDERFIHRIHSAFALPGETMTLRVGPTGENTTYAVHTALATVQTGPNTWTWKAPQEPGIYPVNISHVNGAVVQLNVFVMAPLALAKTGSLNGYRIGHYPTASLSPYPPPRGFIEVTEENENTLVSPHFRLRQFLCKQEGAYPKYLVLDPRLLVVLEAILLKINERGHHTPTLSIMSGYRTPYYNRAIGNSTTYSRHLWGDAADIFIDSSPRDGEMDDFNNDGVISIHDTEVLHHIVSKMYTPRAQRFLAGSFFTEPILQHLVINSSTGGASPHKLLTGGLARYHSTRAHGPFVHVDVRGVFTRWGR